MASGAYTHMHTYIHTQTFPHESDFKKPGAHQPTADTPGLKIKIAYYIARSYKYIALINDIMATCA